MRMVSVEAGQTEPCHKQIKKQYANHYPCWQALPIFTVAITTIQIMVVLYLWLTACWVVTLGVKWDYHLRWYTDLPG